MFVSNNRGKGKLTTEDEVKIRAVTSCLSGSHRPCSPDFAPSDFCLFSKMNTFNSIIVEKLLRNLVEANEKECTEFVRVNYEKNKLIAIIVIYLFNNRNITKCN